MCQANAAREKFNKFKESVLSRQAKIRNLVKDLKKNYSQDEMALKQPTQHPMSSLNVYRDQRHVSFVWHF